jgi:arylsulfatase
MFYQKWSADRMFLLVPAQALVGQFLKTFEEFPPRQRPASFSIDQALEKARQQGEAMLTAAAGGAATAPHSATAAAAASGKS